LHWQQLLQQRMADKQGDIPCVGVRLCNCACRPFWDTAHQFQQVSYRVLSPILRSDIGVEIVGVNGNEQADKKEQEDAQEW
jgi:hypothetical protein